MSNRLHLLRQPYRNIAERWVAALRSGEYRQGAGCLHTEDGKYCCLGVLQGPLLGQYIGDNDDCLSIYAFSQSGLKGTLGENDNRQDLADLNDGGWSFQDIADLIESVPVGLWREECFESGRQPTEEG